jgi:hypothetical protein
MMVMIQQAQPLCASLADMPHIGERLSKGQQFNAYQDGHHDECWLVGIGPVSDFACFADNLSWKAANLICDALRHAAGQSPSQSRAYECDDDD